MNSRFVLRLDEIKELVSFCVFCPKMCRGFCPVGIVSAKEALTPWGKCSFLYFLLKDKFKLSQENEYLLWACSSCLRCLFYCEHGVDVSFVLTSFRHNIYKEIGYRSELFEKVKEELEASSIKSKEELLFWKEDIHKGASLCLVVTENSIKAYGEKFRTFLNQFEDRLKKKIALEIIFPSIYNEYMTATDINFSLNILKIKELSKKYKLIILIEPELWWFCSKKLKLKNISHIVDVINMDISIEGKRSVGGALTYQIPCYFRDEPLKIELLNRIVGKLTDCKFINTKLNDKDSVCCGRGGGFYLVDSVTSKKISEQNINRIKSLGVEKIITFCPKCYLAYKEFDIEVVDFIELI